MIRHFFGQRSSRSRPTGFGSRGGTVRHGEVRAGYWRDYRATHPEYRERERRRLLLHHAIARLTRVLAGGTYARPS